MTLKIPIFPTIIFALLLLTGFRPAAFGQADPGAEPTVLAVKKVWPAVVNINTEGIRRLKVEDPYDRLFNQFFGGPMRPPRELRQRVQSLGSGFIVDPRGYIVTNEHVVERAVAMKIHVTMADGKTYEARYISGDPSVDLAVIKIESPTPLPFINLKDPSPDYLGETVLAIGNPLGYGLSVSRGIVSAINRTITVNDVEYKNLVQTDAAINPGNSGGPLVDISGKLVGISSVKLAYTPQGSEVVPTQGLGFGIPAAVVQKKFEELMKAPAPALTTSETARASTSAAMRYFGIQIQDLNKDLTDVFGYAPGRGVLIADVENGSPASDVGLKRGLVIYRVGRYEVNSAKELESLLGHVASGQVADFQIGAIRQVGRRYVEDLQTVSLTARQPE